MSEEKTLRYEALEKFASGVLKARAKYYSNFNFSLFYLRVVAALDRLEADRLLSTADAADRAADKAGGGGDA